MSLERKYLFIVLEGFCWKLKLQIRIESCMCELMLAQENDEVDYNSSCGLCGAWNMDGSGATGPLASCSRLRTLSDRVVWYLCLDWMLLLK